MLEKEIEEKLGKAVHSAGGLYYKFVSPGNEGVPDRIIILPGGRVFFVELKSETGRITAKQKFQLQRLLDQGCDARVVKGEAEVKKFRKEVLKL